MSDNIDIKQSRFRDASWFDKLSESGIPIIVGGAGGIGSWLVLFLARMLPSSTSMFVFDDDNVEEVNMAGQLYSSDHIDMSKVDAVANIVKKFSGYTGLIAMKERYEEKSLRGPIMFSAFDNMKARKDMFENWKKEAADFEESLFVDGRLLAEQFQVYFVTPDRIENYEKTLFDDSEVDDVSCSYKQTSHFAANIAAKMVQGFTNWMIPEFAELPFSFQEVGVLFQTLDIEINEKKI